MLSPETTIDSKSKHVNTKLYVMTNQSLNSHPRDPANDSDYGARDGRDAHDAHDDGDDDAHHDHVYAHE